MHFSEEAPQQLKEEIGDQHHDILAKMDQIQPFTFASPLTTASMASSSASASSCSFSSVSSSSVSLSSATSSSPSSYTQVISSKMSEISAHKRHGEEGGAFLGSSTSFSHDKGADNNVRMR